MPHPEIRPSNAAVVRLEFAHSGVRIPPENGSSARPFHNAADTSSHARVWERTDWRHATGSYIARSEREFADEPAQKHSHSRLGAFSADCVVCSIGNMEGKQIATAVTM